MLYILDNSEIKKYLINDLKKEKNIKHIRNPENMGIGYFLNLLLDLICNQSKWVFTMDQDRHFRMKI